MKHRISPILFLLFSCSVAHSQVIPGFNITDTICVNSPVAISNTTINGSKFFWNFCVADLTISPEAINLGNPGGFSQPVFLDYVFDNNNYYAFVSNYSGGNLIRLDFGNSLLNNPKSVNLGNFGGTIPIPTGSEGIQIVKNNGRWYAIMVGGYPPGGSTPRILKIDFGADITNTSPTITSWGNIGNLLQPIDLHVFTENNRWYGFTVNAENNTITRFDFGSNFDTPPVGVNLGNIGNLEYPTGIYAINDNGNWRVFITNAGDRTQVGGNFSLTRLDFGNSLLNTPTGVNLGNPGSKLHHPRDLTIMRSCGQIVGFAVNGHPNYNDIVSINFNDNLQSVPTINSLGNIGNLAFPHSISKLFRVGDEIYGFVTNASNHTLTRFRFPGCTNANMASFEGKNPPAITYNQPGTYNINLTVDEGLPTQSSICKQVVVIPNADFNFEQDPCNPKTVTFTAAGNNPTNTKWTFGDGNTNNGSLNPQNIYSAYGNYNVELSYTGACATKKRVSVSLENSNIILTPDTTICDGTPKQLRTASSLSFCWTPTTYLDNPLSPNPVTLTPNNITYYFTAQVPGNNLITNGDFSSGNTGFTSAYSFTTSNNTEGQYGLGSNPQSWNPSLSTCKDHTSTTGNMMFVNGSPTADVKVWEQSVTITANTNYGFSTWIQSLYSQNPAKLQFSINGQVIGDIITGPATTCTWDKFYTIWNSGNSTTAVISIVNKNTLIQGNDFALDDISFSAVLTQRDSVKIVIEKPFIQTSNDTLVCSKSPVQLNTIGASTYTWIPATNLSNSNIANPIASPAATTKYIVTGITANGCTAKDSLIISTNPNPVTSITDDTLVCRNAYTQLFATGGTTYSWSPAEGLNNPNSPTPVVSTLENKKYKVRVTDNNNCSSEDSVNITVRPYPDFKASVTPIICDGSQTKLAASGGDIYYWSPAALVNDPSAAQTFSTPNTNTVYSVIINDNICGFDTTINKNVIVNPVPVMTVQKSNDINCNVPTAQLNATGALRYNWSPASGVDNPIISNPEAAIDSTTIFIITGTNEFGCSSSASITVLADNKGGVPRFVVPNAFTPNGDGKNDCFGIRRWGNATIAQFSIYNRWGQIVFQTKDPRKCWDGTFNGKQHDAGGYIYVIQATTLCGAVTRKGAVTLIR